jgi:hypothetical protein
MRVRTKRLACLTGSTCVLPTNATAYPVTITTAVSAPVPVDTFAANTGTGIGPIVIGGCTSAHPVGWWLSVQSSVPAGTYLSTLTFMITAGP